MGLPQADPETIALAREYRDLRQQSSHWKGGTWNDDVDQFGGRMHVVLQELAKRVSEAGQTRAQVLDLMGEPDAVRKQADEELLIYFWRGWHDYLFFVCRNELIRKADWYHAYE
jgi:hypothetical protein